MENLFAAKFTSEQVLYSARSLKIDITNEIEKREKMYEFELIDSG